MLHRTVSGKKLSRPKIVAMTITVFTNRYGASLRRNLTTSGSLKRRSSSAVGNRSSSEYEYAGGCAGIGAGMSAPASTGVGRISGMWPVSSAATSEPALGKRIAGSFSRHIITARDRSCGTSLRRWATGVGRSEMCFTSMAGVLFATNGGSPTSI